MKSSSFVCPGCGNDKINCVCIRQKPRAKTGGKDAVPQAVLDNAKIPALSAAWIQNGETHSLVGGVLDYSNPIPADEESLFQAASLSKPVSAAIILDLVAQGKWNLNTPLAEIADFGSEEIKQAPHYAKLTTRMIIGQCSGLPNWFDEGATEKFKATPGSHFTYSGVAYQYLKEVLEKTLGKESGKTWEQFAQDFFVKAGMTHSTFQHPSHTHLKNSALTRGHKGDGTPDFSVFPEGVETFPAGSLRTTAEDYICFLQYCHAHLNNLFSSYRKLTPTQCPKTPKAHEQITWGLGMGIFKEGNREIAFHWGSPGYAFFAMDIKTGDAVACFANSENGPNVFQTLSENIVGDLQSVFEWLSEYSGFKPAVKSTSPEMLQAFFSETMRNKELQRDQVSVGVLPQAGLMAVANTAPVPQPSSNSDEENSNAQKI